MFIKIITKKTYFFWANLLYLWGGVTRCLKMKGGENSDLYVLDMYLAKKYYIFFIGYVWNFKHRVSSYTEWLILFSLFDFIFFWQPDLEWITSHIQDNDGLGRSSRSRPSQWADCQRVLSLVRVQCIHRFYSRLTLYCLLV